MEGDAGEATCEPGYTLSGNSTLVCTNGDFKTVSGGTIECLEVSRKRLICDIVSVQKYSPRIAILGF